MGLGSAHRPALGRRGAGRDWARKRSIPASTRPTRSTSPTGSPSPPAPASTSPRSRLTDELGNDPALNGSHDYSHFNPMIGATYKLTPNLTLYGDYAIANRAPTPLELGCSDPLRPCLIDNALVGDPDLQQVVTYTGEAGLRGRFGIAQRALELDARRLSRAQHQRHHRCGVPHPGLRIVSERRRHAAPGDRGQRRPTNGTAGTFMPTYTSVDATFRNYLTLSSPFNPFADANGNIYVVPGDHLRRHSGLPLQGRRRLSDHRCVEIRRRPQRHRQPISGRRRIQSKSRKCRPIGW